MMPLFNPHTVLELLQLTPDECSWLRTEAQEGRAWSTVAHAPGAVFDLLMPIWQKGSSLWEGSNDSLRDEHLHPGLPFWEFLLLGWAQVRLRGTRSEMNRRDVAWAAAVKASIVGFFPDFPGSSDYAYKQARDRVFQLAETLGATAFPRDLKGTDVLVVNRQFTILAFGMLLDMLLDPDRDLMVGRITRAIGLLDKAKQFVKSEDVAQARKLLADMADVKALAPGAGIKMKGAVDWRAFRAACNEKLEERQLVGENINPAKVAQALQLEEEYTRKLMDGHLDETLEDAEIRMLAFMVGQVIKVPVGPYLC